MQETPLVSLIICTRNRAEHLRRTLEAVGRLPVPAHLTCEMVVMDNASTDDTLMLAKDYALPNMPVRALSEPTPGKAHGLNRALAAARGDVLLFLDDDVRPPENWIADMTGPILRGEAEAVAGGVRLAPHLIRPWMTETHRAYLASTDYMERQENYIELVGANMALSRAVLDKVPGYDTELGAGTLFVGEEPFLTAQLRQAGFRVVPAWDVAVEHHCDETRLAPKDFITFAQRVGRYRAYQAYHWEHQDYPRVPLHQAKHGLKGMIRRLIHRRSHGAMPTDSDLTFIAHTYFLRQSLIERRRPRNYEKHGLVKLTHE